MEVVRRFTKGAFYHLKVIKLFRSNPKYWPYVLGPLIINIALYLGAFLLFLNYLMPMLQGIELSETPDHWYSAVAPVYNFLLNAASVIVMLAVSAFTFVYILLVVEAPFLALLSEKIEEDLYGNVYESGLRPLMKGVLLGIKNSVIFAVITLFLTALFFLGNFILPGICAVMAVFVIGFYYGLSFLTYSAELRLYSYFQLRKIAKKYKPEVLGLGVVCYLVFLIPVVAAFFLPVAVVAATMMYNEVVEGKAQLKIEE